MTCIFHIATRADWEAAKVSGQYTTSTRGRTLADEGFIHASRRDQVAGVFSSFYADAGEPLVLLAIDPARLSDAEVREERVGQQIYPHIYGPVDRRAVVEVQPLDKRGGTESFLMLFLREMGARMGVAVLVMVLASIGLGVGSLGGADGARQVVGLLVGAAVGVLIGWLVLRRRV